MTFYDLLMALKSDLDDDNNIKTYYFNEKEAFEFLHRGLRYINERLKLTTKYQFITLQPYIDVYSLPEDYISFKNMVDLTSQVVLPYARFNDVRTKYSISNQYLFTAKNNMFQVDESLRKIYFDRIPDERHGFNYKVITDGLSSTPATVLIGDEVDVTDRERTSNVATLTTATDHCLKTGDKVIISDMDDSSYDTASEVEITRIDHETFSYESTGSDEASTAETGGYAYRDWINWQDPVIIKVYDSATKAYSYCRVSMIEDDGNDRKILYISEQNLLGETEPTTNEYIILTDYAMEYVYEPEEQHEEGTGTISVAAGSKAATLTSTSGMSVGDGIYVPGYGMQMIDTVASATSLTMKEVFSNYNTITTEKFYLMNCNAVPKIPVEFHEMIVVAAKLYAFMRESRHDLVRAQKEVLDGMISECKTRQVKEAIYKMNGIDRGYDRGIQTMLPPKWSL